MALSKNDPNSYARPDFSVITHIDLKLKVDFEKKILSGTAILNVLKTGDSNELILDNRDLNILSVKNADNEINLSYKIDSKIEYGSRFVIYLPKYACSLDDDDKRCTVEIIYETAPNATALQWLTPEQTAGGKHPYLFSQCEALHARSLIPCQDTPSVKFTYTAQITAPKEMTVLMSALLKEQKETENTKVYTYSQSIPIPSYLVAIAVGVLASKKIGPRTTVWAEQEYIEQSAYEFAETETMLKIAEDICGQYVWGVYDLLVLPPSFPYGGMENPCLTFVTPSLLAGDRSLANVVAHEISHSWTGNLVTNANFEHFWLNEGFTMFVERKINGRMFGEKYRDFSALIDLQYLEESVETFGKTNQLTKLVPSLIGINPDDTFSPIPYEKGHTFLYYLEQLLGGPNVFEPFLKSYLATFQYKSVVTNDWKEYLYKYFSDKTELLNSVDWNAWLYEPGMPPVIPNYDKSLAVACTELAQKWITWDENSSVPFDIKDLQDFTPIQKKTFIADLYASSTVLSEKKLKTMQSVYNIDSVKNSEIRFLWLRLCIKSLWASKVPDALKFATDLERLKFVRPIFRDLYNWEEMRQTAIDAYLKNKNKMMYITAHMLAKDLHLSE
ncbi:PREDICTED: leukotriene A-4 hydrolase [Polistes dominula]|uniref:Leukotriene A(4) hydrolase n=1 Tax=Polistes dominula TaxID=743375 RepID=A0ABM1IBF8_POLDO|nr:PREDICTED: leukotriene A-4 hydrolase [Polistes dominula]XP_015177545.1 PREDICTED: leukotriene A-4 hydrolase [Polistes dominula]